MLIAIPDPIFPIGVHEIDEDRREHEIDCVIHGKSLQTNFEDAISGLDGCHSIKESESET